jgi:hypothetical protein
MKSNRIYGLKYSRPTFAGLSARGAVVGIDRGVEITSGFGAALGVSVDSDLAAGVSVVGERLDAAALDATFFAAAILRERSYVVGTPCCWSLRKGT